MQEHLMMNEHSTQYNAGALYEVRIYYPIQFMETLQSMAILPSSIQGHFTKYVHGHSTQYNEGTLYVLWT